MADYIDIDKNVIEIIEDTQKGAINIKAGATHLRNLIYETIKTLNKSVSPTIGVNNAYDVASTISKPDGYSSLLPLIALITVSGVDTTNAETITVKIEYVYTDGTSDFEEFSYTADVTDDLIHLNYADGKQIDKVNIYAKSSLASTTASVTVKLRGFIG